MLKKYLITGGTGFIGSAIVRGLVARGHSVRVVDNNWRGSERRLQDVAGAIDFIEGDVRDPKVLSGAAKGMEGVIHLAFINGTRYFYEQPELVLEVGVKGMLNVLDACLEHSIQELVVASSSEVYQSPPVVPTPETVPLVVPDPKNPRYSYGGGKIISELLALNYGRSRFERVLIFRPHNVYGPDMGFEHILPEFVLRMAGLASQNQGRINFPVQGDGRQTRAFNYIDDFVDGFMLMLEKGSHLGIYHIGAMDEISVETVAREVACYFGREINIVSGEPVKGETLRRCPDISLLRSLGYEPAVPFRQGLKHLADWYVNYYNTMQKENLETPK